MIQDINRTEILEYLKELEANKEVTDKAYGVIMILTLHMNDKELRRAIENVLWSDHNKVNQ